MSDNKEIEEATSIAVIGGSDGPTAIFIKRKSHFKTTKQKVFFALAIILVLAVVIEGVIALFLSGFVFKNGGWKSFEEYSYGTEITVTDENEIWLSETSENIEVDNGDGKKLHGLKITNENISHSYAVVCHQYGGSSQTMTAYVKHFYELGFNIVLPDLRGHGKSEYKNISMGWKDSDDIKTWIENIISEDEKAKIVLFGVSLGANAVTLAASEELPENVKLVISDSCYTSVRDLMKEYVNNEIHLPAFPVLNMTSALAESKVGDSFKNADTVGKLKNIDLPIMFINGEEDNVVPPLVSKKLYENCNAEGVEEVIIPEGTHGGNLKADETTYWAKIDTFILNNLGI